MYNTKYSKYLYRFLTTDQFFLHYFSTYFYNNLITIHKECCAK